MQRESDNFNDILLLPIESRNNSIFYEYLLSLAVVKKMTTNFKYIVNFDDCIYIDIPTLLKNLDSFPKNNIVIAGIAKSNKYFFLILGL